MRKLLQKSSSLTLLFVAISAGSLTSVTAHAIRNPLENLASITIRPDIIIPDDIAYAVNGLYISDSVLPENYDMNESCKFEFIREVDRFVRNGTALLAIRARNEGKEHPLPEGKELPTAELLGQEIKTFSTSIGLGGQYITRVRFDYNDECAENGLCLKEMTCHTDSASVENIQKALGNLATLKFADPQISLVDESQINNSREAGSESTHLERI